MPGDSRQCLTNRSPLIGTNLSENVVRSTLIEGRVV